MWILPLLIGCKAVDDVPEDVDGVMHYLWLHHDAGTAEEIAEGIVALDAALGAATLEEATDGALSRLTAEEVAFLDTSGDPSLAAGIFLGNPIQCRIGMVAEIVTWPNQDVLYPGVYDAYARTYDGDIAAFLAGDTDALEWGLDYEASVLGASYTGHTDALMRRVTAFDALDTPITEAYLVRYHAPEPAQFEEGSSKTFDQDYQFEIYWRRERDVTVHAYGMWRQANWGVGFTSDDESVQRILLNGMVDWDHDTDDICAEGGPAVVDP